MGQPIQTPNNLQQTKKKGKKAFQSGRINRKERIFAQQSAIHIPIPQSKAGIIIQRHKVQ